MKGIILAGGSGTRLYPVTKSVSKQIIPIYDKPMIYYPLSVLMLAGITEILIISTKRDVPVYEELLQDGNDYGLKIEYAVQEAPNGLAEAFLIGERFIGNDSVSLILGDNIFYGRHFSELLARAADIKEGAMIFGYYVMNPTAFGIVEFDEDGNAISVEEKPQKPKSNYAIPGLYFYDNRVASLAKQAKPSARGELEITTLSEMYLQEGKLDVQLLGRGFAWLDTGTMDSPVDAADFVRMVEKRQGIKISAPEEIAYKNGWITKEKLLESAQRYGKSPYGMHLKQVAENKIRY